MEGTVLSNVLQSVFSGKVVEVRKCGMPCFSCRSLLLSTIIFNDIMGIDMIYVCTIIWVLMCLLS